MPKLHPARAATLLLGSCLAAACAGPLSAQQVDGGPFHAATCPVPDGVSGYPLAVELVDAGEVDPSYASALADALARRWEPPSRARSRHAGLGRVSNRIATPEPLWPDDWLPESRHRARLTATLHRDGGTGSIDIASASGDRAFDRSLAPMLAARNGDVDLPPFPPSLGADSLRIVVTLGDVPGSGSAGLVRFAAQQSPVRVVPGTLRVMAPTARGGRTAARPSATVKYDVDEHGRVEAGSIQVLQSSDPAFSRAVTDGLRQARFVAAQANCRPIARSVAQRFGDR